MNKYLIQKGVLTPIHMFDKQLETEGYIFSQWGGYENHRGLFVEKEIQSPDFSFAYRFFILKLLPILNRISVLTQCSIEPLSRSSALVYRVNNNPDQNIFFYLGRAISPVGMDLNSDTLGDISKTSDSNLEIVFDLLRESNYATTPKMQLALLVNAAEALAGEIENSERFCKSGELASPKHKTLNKQKMETIITRELYLDMYNKSRVRQRLFHGGSVDDDEAASYCSKLYHRILFGYLKPTFNLLSISEDVKNAPRNSGAYEFGGAFLRLGGKETIDFDRIESQFDDPVYENVGDIPEY